MITTNDEKRTTAFGRRALWSLLLSLGVNALVLITYPSLAYRRDVRDAKPPVVSVIRLERRVPTPRPTKPPKPPVIVHTPELATPKPKPTPAPPPPVRKKPVAVLPKRRARAHLTPPAVSKLPVRDIAGSPSMTFQHQGTNLKMPPSYDTQDLANGAATDISKYVDFSKAKGAFVPQVWVVHLNVSYLTAPTLDAAVKDITASLAPDDAKISASKAQTVCHGKVQAWFLEYSRPGQDLPGEYENILFLSGDTMYREMYSRPLGQAEDPGTRAAMNAACPKAVPPHM